MHPTATPAAASSTTPDLRSVAARLLHGAAVYTTANFGLRAVGFLLLPLYARFLSPADYGTVSLADAAGAVVGLLATLGLPAAMQRLYFAHVHDRRRLRQYLSTVIWFGIATAAAMAAIALLVGPNLVSAVAADFQVPFYPYLALAITAACLQPVSELRLSLYQSEERPRSYALLAATAFAMTAGAVIALVVAMQRGAYGMLLGKAVGAALTALLSLALLAPRLHARFEWAEVRESLQIAVPLVPHTLMALGLVAADRFILQAYRPVDEVGIYSLAYTLGMAMYMVANSLGQAWNPLFYDSARHGAESRALLGRLTSALALLLIGVAGFGSAIARPIVAFVFDSRYAAAGPLVPIIIAGYLFHAFFSLLQLPVVQARRTQYVLAASATAFAANLVLNFWWIPRWGMYGSAYATAAAYAVEAAVMYGFAQRVFPLTYRRAAVAVALAAFAAIVVLTQFSALPNIILVGGFVLFTALLAALAGSDARKTLAMVRERLRR